SDGTSELVRRDPATLEPLEVIRVRLDGERVMDLNDLEWAAGRVWANLLGKRYLVGIDAGSGEVTDLVDAKAVMERHWGDPEAVLNGVAALPGDGEFLLTGKSWRSMYHVRLAEDRPRKQPARLLADCPAATGPPPPPGRTPHRSALRLPGAETLLVPGASPRAPMPPALLAGAPPARPSAVLACAPPARRPAREAM